MSGGMSCALEGEGHRCLNCEAYRAGRAAGYAEAVADVVAWLRGRVGRLSSYTYGDGSNERDVLERVAEDLEDTDGAHVGAAKKGGSQ